jgi:FkbM family methyltransferase
MIKRIISGFVRKAIQNFGYEKKFAFVSMGTTLALKRIASRGITINSVLDVGASNGSWSLEARQCWPDAHYHLVEANEQHRSALVEMCSATPRFSYVLAAASDEPGTIFFDGSDAFGGLAMKGESQSKRSDRTVPAVTLDGEVKSRGLTGPYLVKLDTHGFEVPILNGAKEVLAEANLVVIETYNFQLETNSLKFWQMCRFMDDLGFGVIDISEPLWRLKEDAFWQIDLFFIPKSRPEFSYNRYA